MAQPPRGSRTRPSKSRPKDHEAALSSIERSTAKADELLAGASTPELDGREHLASIVRTVARRIGSSQDRLSGGATLETMARLTQDSLLNTPVDSQVIAGVGATSAQIGAGAQTLKDTLDKVEAGLINDVFFSEKDRIEDYETFAQIYDLITLCAEAAQTYCDSIISPDDWTKRDLNVFYEGPGSEDDDLCAAVRGRCAELTEKYQLDDKIEIAIVQSLVKGDYFVAVLNLRQELETVLSESGKAQLDAPTLLTEHHVPDLTDDELQALGELLQEHERGQLLTERGSVRSHIAAYLNGLVSVQEDARAIGVAEADARVSASSGPGAKGRARRGETLAGSNVRGSIVKMIPPENVVKLYQGDVLFGYYFIELEGPSVADFGRRGSQDQTAVVRAIDRNLSARFLSGNQTGPENAKQKLIGRIIAKTLAAKLGNAAFLKKSEQFAQDAYAILQRARREGRRVTITFVAPDQMVHFMPNGSSGYGESVLSRVKFMAKLYIGAITNAFMRNAIRRPERLVWYLDVGVDNDGNNAIQNFIRTVKQREVKFSNLKDITTTINHIGEFHDFYVPTFNGERPLEVETLNMGAAAEVDNAFLEFLRKGIIAGMGVPAAFVGYSEEVAFARGLVMDNGRFLRRVVRHQKHYGRAATRLVRALYRNEYLPLEELTGSKKGGKEVKSKADEKAEDADAVQQILIERLWARFPSPASLNMQNLSDAINQASQVVEFVAEHVGAGEEDDIKSLLKAKVVADMLPQLHWDRYRDMLEAAKGAAGRIKAGKVAESEGGSFDSTSSAPSDDEPSDSQQPDGGGQSKDGDSADFGGTAPEM